MLYVTFNALKSSFNVDHLTPSIDFGEVLKINQYPNQYPSLFQPTNEQRYSLCQGDVIT